MGEICLNCGEEYEFVQDEFCCTECAFLYEEDKVPSILEGPVEHVRENYPFGRDHND